MPLFKLSLLLGTRVGSFYGLNDSSLIVHFLSARGDDVPWSFCVQWHNCKVLLFCM